MKFDPLKKEVYTDHGEFIKKMYCPFRVNWEDLERTTKESRTCKTCAHLIVDTEQLTDTEILHLVKENPNTCLKIDLHQPNITIVTNGIGEPK